MAPRSVRRKPGLSLGTTASREYVDQRSPTSNSSESSGSSGRSSSDGSCNYESDDDSDGDDGVHGPGQPRDSSGLTASDIAQRALRELDTLFADMYDNQRAGGSRSDMDSSDDGQELASISLEELTIALNAAIERQRPAPGKEESPQRRRRGGVAKVDVTGDNAPTLPQDVVVPIAHFQDVFQQRIKCFQASKQGSTSPTLTLGQVPTTTRSQPQRERQRRRYRTNIPPPPPSQASDPSLYGSSSSVSARSEVSISGSEWAASHISRESYPTEVFRRVETLDQQLQTPQVCMRDQATEIRDLFDARSPGSEQGNRVDSSSAPVLTQRSDEMEIRRRSERVSPSTLRIESSQAGPTLDDLVSERSSHRVGTAARQADGLSSRSSRSSPLSHSSLSSESSASEHRSHCSSRTSSQRSRHATKTQSPYRHSAHQVRFACYALLEMVRSCSNVVVYMR